MDKWFIDAFAACADNKDVYMCTVSNGRSDLRVSDSVGMFVNTLAIPSCRARKPWKSSSGAPTRTGSNGPGSCCR